MERFVLCYRRGSRSHRPLATYPLLSLASIGHATLPLCLNCASTVARLLVNTKWLEIDLFAHIFIIVYGLILTKLSRPSDLRF